MRTKIFRVLAGLLGTYLVIVAIPMSGTAPAGFWPQWVYSLTPLLFGALFVHYAATGKGPLSRRLRTDLSTVPQPTVLVGVLLDLDAPVGDRDDAAVDLAGYDDLVAEDALMKVVTNPSEDEIVLDTAVESLREIWRRKGRPDESLLEMLPPKARKYWYD